MSRRIEQEEVALPAFSVQGTGQATPAVTPEWRQRSMRTFERVMQERLPEWAEQKQRRANATPP